MKKAGLILTLSAFLCASCHWGNHFKTQGYVEGQNTYLASPFYGILVKLGVHRGQHVDQGQFLFQLDPNPQQIIITQSQSELEQAKKLLADLEKPRRAPEIEAIKAQIEQTNAQIQLALVRVERQKKLFTKMATSKDTVDAAEAHLLQQQQLKAQYEDNLALAALGSREDQINAQKEQVKSLEAKLLQAQWDLKQKTIVAPDSGVIFDTYYNEGELVASQRPVVSLLSPQQIRIEFFIPMDRLAAIQLGQKITFDCEGCSPNNEATINYISPDAEYIPPLVYSRDNYSKLVFRIKAAIASPEKFKPGQPVVVNL